MFWNRKKITVGEEEPVIKDMKQPSPRSNGLTIGFYKEFFSYLGENFIEILNDSESNPKLLMKIK